MLEDNSMMFPHHHEVAHSSVCHVHLNEDVFMTFTHSFM